MSTTRIKLDYGHFGSFISLLIGNDVLHVPASNSMFYQYMSKLREFYYVQILASHLLPNPYPLYCLHVDQLPAEDKLVIEFINSIEPNELWTNMAFMDEFRKRLRFYKMYPDE